MKEMMLRTISLFIFIMMSISAMAQIQQGSDGIYYDGQANLFTGIYTEYYPDSLIRTSIEITNGRPDGLSKIYFDYGQLEEIRSYKNGLMHGKWEKWNRQNIKIAEAGYKDNKKDGKWYIWDDNGTLRYDMTYESGEKKGSWFMYDEDGKLISQKDY